MNELRRCSPEIERELHDKEARIRELEGAMDEAWGVIANASDWIPKEPGTPCERSRADWQEAAERWRDERFHPLLRATSPPDSELAEGERSTESPNPTRPDGGRFHTAPPQRQDAGDALRQALSDPDTMQRVTERAFRRQDAMLERREDLERLIEEIRVNGLSDDTEDQLRQALSRTSDAHISEATVDEIVSEYEWRGEDEEGREGGYDPTDAERCMLKDFAMFLLSEVGIRTSDEGTGCVVPEALEEVYSEEIVYEVMSSFDGALDEPCLCGSPDGEFGCPQCSALETAQNKLRQALSRTSDEGTGCVVPEDRESALWLMARIIERHTEKPPGPPDPPFDRQPEWVRKAYYRQAERAIAEQGGQTAGWTHIDQKLPQPFVHVALCTDDRYENAPGVEENRVKAVGYLNNSSGGYWSIMGERATDLRAYPWWAPLPAAPQSEHGESDE